MIPEQKDRFPLCSGNHENLPFQVFRKIVLRQRFRVIVSLNAVTAEGKPIIRLRLRLDAFRREENRENA